MSTRAPLLTRGQLIVVLVTVVAVIAAVVGAAAVVPSAVRAAAPDLPVRAYLRAIVDGDATQALKVGRITAGKNDVLLTDAALKHATARVTAFTVLATTQDGDKGSVATRITQGGSTYTADFAVEHPSANPFAPWRLASQELPRVTVELQAPLALVVSLGGASVTASQGAVAERVFPGTYRATVHTGDMIVGEDVAATATFAQPHPDPVLMRLALSSQGESAAQSQVSAWVDRCAASTELAPAGCPFKAVPQASVTYSDGRWTLESAPTFDVGQWSASAGGWPVVTSAPGYVRFTARAAQGGLTGTATTGSNPFSVAGTITPEAGGGVRFVPSPKYSDTDTSGSLT